MTAVITFDGETVVQAEKNGDCYITDSKPDFPESIGTVTIESEEGTGNYEEAILIECASVDGRYWFAFAEKPEAQKEKESLQADIEAQAEAIVELASIIAEMEA